MKIKVRCTSQGGNYVVIGQRGKKRYRFTGTSHEREVTTTEFTSEVFAESEWREVRFDEVPHRMVKQVCKTLGIETPKKVKLWYKSGEIAHVWANEGAPKGESPGNMSFDGAAFYSYGTTIARIMHAKKKRVYVLDSAGFSPSTSAHQGCVRHAVGNDAVKFFVNCGCRGQSLRFTPEELRDNYLDGFYDTEPKKMAHEIAAMTLRRYGKLDEALRVCEVFGLPKKELCATLRRGKADVEEASEVCRLHGEKKAERRKHLDATKQDRAIQRAVVYAETYLADPTLVRYAGAQSLLIEHRHELWAQVAAIITERNAASIRAWRNGETNETDYSWPLMLRREGNECVSSQGARVPIADAERTYRFIEKVKAKGWHANGKQHQIGMYALRHVRTDVVQIGCHTISLEECHRFAAQQGW